MNEEPKVAAEKPEIQPTPAAQPRNKTVLFGSIAAVVVVIIAGGAFAMHSRSGQSRNNVSNPDQGQQRGSENDHGKDTQTSESSRTAGNNSTDPTLKGKALSNNECTGTGSKTLSSAPMASKDIGVITPMGNMIGGHVTPIDHEYYYQKNPSAPRDTYDVMAPADGSIVDIQHRTSFIGNQSDAPTAKTDEYRMVISYSCTFFSYFDLVTSLDTSIISQLPSNFATTGRMGQTPIAIKAGQVIAHVGGQSLDFAVWDTTKPTKNLLNPTAFNNAEAWKIVTVAPLNYFSDSVKAQILPFYARTTEPRDGVFAYDVTGTAIGDWFLAGTNGYHGSTDPQPKGNYYAAHLAIAPDAIDTKAFVFSVGTYDGGDATQFAIVGNTPDPATVTPATGLVKYTLAQFSHSLPNGQQWTGSAPADGITVKASAVKGVALIQLTGAQTMKVEVFPGKTAAQVTAFDDKAQTYDRGQTAVMVSQ
ncbi:MAG: hypothetical protein WCO52_05285 [bacterium]